MTLHTDSRSEDYILIERWDNQVGGWMNLDEAGTVAAAHNKVHLYQQEEAAQNAGEVSTYSIVMHKRVIVPATQE